MPSDLSAEVPEVSGRRTLSTVPVLLLVGLVGVLSGVFAAYSYYDDLLRAFAHALTPWVLLAVVVSARRPTRDAALRTVTGLVGAVVAFYVGKPLFYGVHYPNVPTIGVNPSDVVLWTVFAVFSGTVLGGVFSRIGGASWASAAATAAAIALLAAATISETGFRIRGDDLLLIAFSACAVAVVLFLADTTGEQLKRTAVLVVPLVLASLALVTAPDLIEQVLIQL
ncbi:hypothetical protein [Parasphingorhabdus pacifica]